MSKKTGTTKKKHKIGMSTSVATKIAKTFIAAEYNGLRTFGFDDEKDSKMFDSKYNEIENS